MHAAHRLRLRCGRLECGADRLRLLVARHFLAVSAEAKQRRRSADAVAARQVQASHEEGRGEGVALGAVGAHHAHAEDARGGPARARIDHVAIASPFHLEELLARPARGQRAVPEHEAREPIRLRPPRAHVDRPAAAASAQGHRAAPPPGQERVAHAPRAQELCHPVKRVSLADGAEVELHARARETHGAGRGVHLDRGHADQGPRRGDRLLRGQAALAPQEPPATAQGRARDVERAFRRGMERAAPPQEREELGARDGLRPARFAVEPAERARLAEDAQLRLEAVRLVEGFARRTQPRRVLAMEEHLEAAGHGHAVDAHPMALLLARRSPEREQLAAAQGPGESGWNR